jgi:hypothetical protein
MLVLHRPVESAVLYTSYTPLVVLRRASEMDPMVGINHELGARGERERALGILRELHARPIPHAAFVAALIVALQSPDRGDAVLEQQDSARPPEEWIALGMPDRFLERLQELAISGRLYNQPGWLRTVWLPSSGPIHEDPRFFVVADVLGFVKLWESRGYLPGCQRVTLPAGDRLDCAGLAR